MFDVPTQWHWFANFISYHYITLIFHLRAETLSLRVIPSRDHKTHRWFVYYFVFGIQMRLSDEAGREIFDAYWASQWQPKFVLPCNCGTLVNLYFCGRISIFVDDMGTGEHSYILLWWKMCRARRTFSISGLYVCHKIPAASKSKNSTQETQDDAISPYAAITAINNHLSKP